MNAAGRHSDPPPELARPGPKEVLALLACPSKSMGDPRPLPSGSATAWLILTLGATRLISHLAPPHLSRWEPLSG